jgi:hypothetical protein
VPLISVTLRRQGMRRTRALGSCLRRSGESWVLLMFQLEVSHQSLRWHVLIICSMLKLGRAALSKEGSAGLSMR